MVALVLISGCALTHKRPPYLDPDRLVSVVKIASAGEEPILGTDLLALRNESRTLKQIAAYRSQGLSLTDGGTSERIHSAQISAELFSALGVTPALGRVITPEECKPGSGLVVVISHGLWQRRFGADPSIIGRTITLDQEQRTVVGVMAQGFRFPNDRDLWTPLAFDDKDIRSGDKSFGLEVFARLNSGATLEQAQAEMS